MEEEYDTDAFVVFMIAMISIYILIAAVFIYKRIRRFLSKEPVVGGIYPGMMHRRRKRRESWLKWRNLLWKIL